MIVHVADLANQTLPFPLSPPPDEGEAGRYSPEPPNGLPVTQGPCSTHVSAVHSRLKRDATLAGFTGAPRRVKGSLARSKTVNGFVRVLAKNRDIPGNSEVCNLLTTQELATPGNPVKCFEVLAGHSGHVL